MIKSDWCYWKSAVSSDMCDEIVKSALKIPRETPTLGYNLGHQDSNMRRSYVRWVNETNEELKWTFDLMWRYLRVMNNDWFGYNVTHLPPIQFTEYDASYQGEYKRHQDVFWINDSNRHRKVSLIIQLSDPSEYRGGDLRIESIVGDPSPGDRLAMREKGTVIAFPSFTWHALEPVTFGHRHSLVAWFEGPKFT